MHVEVRLSDPPQAPPHISPLTVVVDVGGRSIRVGGPVSVGPRPGRHWAPVTVASIERQVGVDPGGLIEAVDAAAVEGETDERAVAGRAAEGGEGGRGGVDAGRVLVCSGFGGGKRTGAARNENARLVGKEILSSVRRPFMPSPRDATTGPGPGRGQIAAYSR